MATDKRARPPRVLFFVRDAGLADRLKMRIESADAGEVVAVGGRSDAPRVDVVVVEADGRRVSSEARSWVDSHPHVASVLLLRDDVEVVDAGASFDAHLELDGMSDSRIRRAFGVAMERSRRVAELREREESLFAVVSNTVNGVLVIDERENVVFSNPAAERILSRSRAALLGGRPPFEVPVTESRLSLGDAQHAEIRSIEITWHGGPARMLLVRDVSKQIEYHASLERANLDLHAANERLEELARVDPLTDLLNRRGFERALVEELSRAARDGSHTSCVLVDCDDFKRINDDLGHDIGDAVLREVARRLRTELRPSDRVARVGGDEFLLLLPGTRVAEALLVAERVREVLADGPVVTTCGDVAMTASLAVVDVGGRAGTLENILARAHEYLQSSKRSGKNRVSGGVGCAATSTGPAAPAAASISALKVGAPIQVVSLPIYSLASTTIRGHELFVRGPNGDRESPADLFRACSDERCLTAVDLNCLLACVSASSGLPGTGVIHVNLFPTTLVEAGSAEVLSRMARGVGLDRYCLELSEHQFVSDSERVRVEVEELRRHGVRIAIDDIGFGRCSLETLILLEPDVIKIARRHVTGVADDRGRQRALSQLVRVARSIGVDLVAEGVATARDLDKLAELGVGYGQGFYWGMPSPVGSTSPGAGVVLAE